MSVHYRASARCRLFVVSLLVLLAVVVGLVGSSAWAASVPALVAGEVVAAPSAARTRSYAYDGLGRRATLSETVAAVTGRYGFVYDAHGSVSLLLDQANGVKASYGYTAYGAPNSVLTKTAAGFTASSNPYRYTGKRFDTGSGTLDVGARRYAPGAGRFLQYDQYAGAFANLELSRDPLNSNRYLFAAANPVTFVDVDGHRVELPDAQVNVHKPFEAEQRAFVAECVLDDGPPCRPVPPAWWEPVVDQVVTEVALAIVVPGPAGVVAKAAVRLKTAIKLGKAAWRARKAAKGGTAIRRVGDVLESPYDALANPLLLAGKSPQEVVVAVRGAPGWRVEALGKGSHKGQGLVLRQYTDAGNPTGTMIRWHPGGGHHGPDPYWRVIDSRTGFKSGEIR